MIGAKPVGTAPMTDYIVTLTPHEFMLAQQVGKWRNQVAVDKGLANYKDRHILGTPAELAVAKFFGVYWHPNVGLIGQPDIEQTEVRSSNSHNHNLIVKPTDKSALPFILVTTELKYEFWLRGWTWGKEAKQEQWWNDSLPDPAYLVPQKFLHNMEDFPMEFIWPCVRFQHEGVLK